jgi:ABC-type Fe3+-hydroxamate transport system substrate-binding protein
MKVIQKIIFGSKGARLFSKGLGQLKVLLLLFALMGPVVVHAQDRPIRIVSLAPSLTKSIYYLGGADQLVGRTSYCHIAEKDHKEVVATAITVNIEKVITLKPDLVVASTITNPETLEIIRRAGIPTKVLSTPPNFEVLCTQFLELGDLIGRSAMADSIVQHTRREVNLIKQSYQNQPRQQFFFQIGAKPLFTVLDNTFMADYISFSGGENIASGLTRGTLNREFVLVKNPDVIIIVNMGIVGEEEKETWEQYPHLNAVKNNKVFFIESDMASTPNPPDFLNTMKAIQKELQ